MKAEKQDQAKESGPKYILNIEGVEYPWEQDTITTEQIAQMGGWDVGQGVIEVDKDNTERNLQPGEIVQVKPGQGFGKKHKWKRGLRSRIEQELALLRQFYHDLEHVEQGNVDWFLLPSYPVPQGWRIHSEDITQARVCFPIEMGYPSAQPYGFLMPTGINFQNSPPGNSGSSATPPFPGPWHHFSWSPVIWFPDADPRKGSNLPAWVRSFTERLREGA